MSQPEDLVVVHSADSPSEAELIRGILESEGVFAVIPDKNSPLPAIDLTPFDGNYSAMGCEVLVTSADLERAKKVIQEARESSIPDSDDEDKDDEGDDEGENE